MVIQEESLAAAHVQSRVVVTVTVPDMPPAGADGTALSTVT